MTGRFTEAEALSTVSRLTRSQLMSFIEAEIVVPLQTERGPVFRDVDIARMELLCELHEDFDLDRDALLVVMSLIDQLHDMRANLRALLAAVEEESEEVRARIAASAARKAGTRD